MKPIVLGISIILFFLCLGIHVLVWRYWRPTRHLSALLAVFLLPFLPFSALLLAFCKETTLLDIAAIGVLHFALSCTYIQIYPAAQAFSPTLVILALVRKSMPDGVTRKELAMRLNDDFLLGARVQDLLEARMIDERDDGFHINSSGARFLQVFIVFRRLLGLDMGKG